jgi:CTP-dependent riboflavin kinase
MKRQLEQWTETTNAAAKTQNTLEMSLSSAQATISQLEEEVSIQRDKFRKCQTLVIQYKSKAAGRDRCFADIAAIVRRAEKQEWEALTPPPTIEK